MRIKCLAVLLCFGFFGCMETDPPVDTPPPQNDTGGITTPDTMPAPTDTNTVTNPPTDTSSPPADTTLTPPDTSETCPTTPGVKRMGSECTADCECDTGYCYDEALMGLTGKFRFCTRACDFGCEYDDNDTGTQQYQCTTMGGKLEKHYGLELPAICVPRCANADDCKVFSSKYDACGNTGGGWTDFCYEDCSYCTGITGVGSCLVTSEMPNCN